MIDKFGASGGIRTGRIRQSSQRKPAPVPQHLFGSDEIMAQCMHIDFHLIMSGSLLKRFPSTSRSGSCFMQGSGHMVDRQGILDKAIPGTVMCISCMDRTTLKRKSIPSLCLYSSWITGQ
jgi:hypothetical protein